MTNNAVLISRNESSTAGEVSTRALLLRSWSYERGRHTAEWCGNALVQINATDRR